MAETFVRGEILLKPKDLRNILEQVRGKSVPERTLRFWRSQLGISPNSVGFYEQEDLDALIGLVNALNRGWTIAQYFCSLRQRCGNT